MGLLYGRYFIIAFLSLDANEMRHARRIVSASQEWLTLVQNLRSRELGYVPQQPIVHD